MANYTIQKKVKHKLNILELFTTRIVSIRSLDRWFCWLIISTILESIILNL